MEIIINIVAAYFGGLAINFIRYCEMKNSTEENRDLIIDTTLYWIQFFVVPLIGLGLCLAYWYSGVNLNPILSIQIGVSAPLIIKSFASATPSYGVERAA